MLGMVAVEGLIVVLRLVAGVVVLDTVLKFVRPGLALERLTGRLTAPLYRPVHRWVDPERAGADFAPMIVIMALILLAQILAPT